MTHIWSYRCEQEWASLCLRQPGRLVSLYYIVSRKYHRQKSRKYSDNLVLQVLSKTVNIPISAF